MTWTKTVLVVANVTSTSDELLDALKAQAQRESTKFNLIIPATPFGGGRRAAIEKLSSALEQLGAAGLQVDGNVCDPDPVVAVTEAWDPKLYDEIIVSTLPMKFSKWLHAGLPERITKLTGAPVTHVVSQPPKPTVETVPPPAHDEGVSGVMRPLSVLGWGAAKD
jgi:GABA permease